MPAWLNFLLPFAVKFVIKFGLPELEKDFPFLAPLVNEILILIGSTDSPSPNLLNAAKHYNAAVAMPSEPVKE